MRRFLSVTCLTLVLGAAGCGSSSDDLSGTGGSAAQGGSAGSAGNSASGGSSGSGGTTASGGSAGSGGGTAPSPKAEFIPQHTGTCPEFKNGAVTFSPAGIPPRSVTLTMSDAAASLHGP